MGQPGQQGGGCNWRGPGWQWGALGATRLVGVGGSVLLGAIKLARRGSEGQTGLRVGGQLGCPGRKAGERLRAGGPGL